MKRRLFFMGLGGLISVAAFGGIRGAKMRVRKSTLLKDDQRSSNSGVLEFTITSDDAFPIRGVDPVLKVGAEEITVYQFVDNKTLLFKCMDQENLRDGALMVLQYGDDEESRTDLGRFRRAEVK